MLGPIKAKPEWAKGCARSNEEAHARTAQQHCALRRTGAVGIRKQVMQMPVTPPIAASLGEPAKPPVDEPLLAKFGPGDLCCCSPPGWPFSPS